MGLLNRFFGSTESTAKEIELDDESILKKWKEYLATISKKKAVIKRLKTDVNLQKDLRDLKKLLVLELTDISDEEKKESELISDLETMEHSQKIKRIQKLERCLGYAETQHEYAYNLLRQLHSVLKSQIHIVEKLLAEPKDAEKLISHIKSQFEIELEITKKIEQTENFHDLFLALVKGEHIIKRMDSGEKKLLKKMQTGINKIFANKIKKGITYNWAITVFKAVEDKIHESVDSKMFSGHHPDIDFEFVNRPEFIGLVRESIQKLREKEVSEQMINVFVHVFREWYNHGRD